MIVYQKKKVYPPWFDKDYNDTVNLEKKTVWICVALSDLVPFVQFKKPKKHP